MSIAADQERAFYDSVYAQHLALPDHALACDRRTLAADLKNPSHPVFERRRLYEGIMQTLLAEPLAGARILDYGCGPGDWGLMMACEGARVTFLDLSPVAVELALRRAAASGVANRVRGEARDGSNLSCFADAEFDLIYGSAAVHHTLKYGDALSELMRVLKPGGVLVLAETYGNNRLLNFVRRLRWRLSGEPVDAGEEIIFDSTHIAALQVEMHRVDVLPMNLLAMAKRVFRGRFTKAWVRALVDVLESVDDVLLRLFPFLKRYCGEVIVIARK